MELTKLRDVHSIHNYNSIISTVSYWSNEVMNSITPQSVPSVWIDIVPARILLLHGRSLYYSDPRGHGYGKHYGANNDHYGSNKHGQYGNHYNKKSNVHYEVSVNS